MGPYMIAIRWASKPTHILMRYTQTANKQHTTIFAGDTPEGIFRHKANPKRSMYKNLSFICHIHNYTEYNLQWNVFSAFHPSKCTHTWSSGQPTLQCPGSSWGFGALLKGLTSVVDNSSRSRDSNTQVTSDYKSNALSKRLLLCRKSMYVCGMDPDWCRLYALQLAHQARMMQHIHTNRSIQGLTTESGESSKTTWLHRNVFDLKG